MKEKWFQKSWRRNLVDMHIPDWNEKFLSEFNPKTYADMMSLAQVDSAMVYANSHVGACYWPSKTGHMHNGLNGRDVLGEVIDLCHQRRINVIIYYSLIFNNWAYENHPDWQIITVSGKEVRQGILTGRYGVCCPNSPYRDFAVAQIEELCKSYEFEGIFFDMTFWPGVCYCSYCKKKYVSETGKELPKIINWEDPKWVRFQRKREEWLVGFASLVNSTVKKIKPQVTLEHNSSTYMMDWQYGVSGELAKQNDYLGGDFSAQEFFACKLCYNLTKSMPFEFMTPCCYSLGGHTTMKPKELLEAQVYSTLAHNGAFLFIDAIDPVGTLNRNVYQKMGEIFRETKKYEEYLGGKLCQDVGIYFSFESEIELSDNGKSVTAEFHPKRATQVKAALCVSKSLLNNHIPFGIITKENLKDLFSYQIIILPNLLMVDKEEVEAFKEFVASGGSLYVSKYTSLVTKDGQRKNSFLLSNLLGVSYAGKTKEEVTYIAPTEEGKQIFLPYSAKYPLTILGSQLRVEASKKAKVLATITLPYTDPKDPARFASIHSNPPGIPTDYPSMVLNEYGKGKTLYVAADLESIELDAHRLVFIKLLKMLSAKSFSFETDAPKSVEVTLFHQEEKKRYLINLVNFQKELPNIPVEGINLRVRLDGKEAKKLIKLPEGKELVYKADKGYAEAILPKLETFLMLALDYK